MGTKITYHQLTVEPSGLAASHNERERRTAEQEGRDPVLREATKRIPHVESGWCQCVSATLVGGGNPDAGRWLLDIIVFEPYAEDEDGEDQKESNA